MGRGCKANRNTDHKPVSTAGPHGRVVATWQEVRPAIGFDGGVIAAITPPPEATALPIPTPTLPTPAIPTPVIPTPTPTPSSSSFTIPSEYLGLPIWAWVAAGLAVVVLIIMLIAVTNSGRKRSQWDRSFGLRIADARWFADSLTLAVADRTMGTAEIVRTWTDGAPRVATLSQRLYELSSVAPTDKRAQAPRRVAQAVDSLRQALDADVRMRTQGFAPGQDTLIAESAVIVAQRRNDLLATVAAVR